MKSKWSTIGCKIGLSRADQNIKLLSIPPSLPPFLPLFLLHSLSSWSDNTGRSNTVHSRHSNLGTPSKPNQNVCLRWNHVLYEMVERTVGCNLRNCEFWLVSLISRPLPHLSCSCFCHGCEISSESRLGGQFFSLHRICMTESSSPRSHQRLAQHTHCTCCHKNYIYFCNMDSHKTNWGEVACNYVW